jgi:DNA-binding NarL/FixJ family response regulator
MNGISSGEKGDKITPQRIRLLLADDDDMTRVLLTTLFGDSPDIEIVGEAPDGETAVEMARELLPDAVIMDVGMPHMSGIDASRIIHSEHPEIQLIALSMFDETEMAGKMKEAGAVCYFCKSEPWSETIAGIHHILAPDSSTGMAGS